MRAAVQCPTMRLAHVFTPTSVAGRAYAPVLSVYREYGVILKSSREDNHNRTPENLDLYQWVDEGDLVVNRMKAWQGSLGISPQAGIVSPDYEVLKPRADRTHGPYMHYLLRSKPLIQQYQLRSTGIRPGQWRLYWQEMRSIEIALPARADQVAIADYLDRETAQIDALIGKQEQLIAKLRERRQAVVLAFVVRGVRGGVPLRSSGVGWVGDIPEHWLAGNIRRFATMKTGHTPSRSVAEYWVNCNIPWVTLADVAQMRSDREMYASSETTSQISDLGLANSAAELLPAGTVMLSRTASVGFSAIMPVAMATSQDYWNWVCGPRLLPSYLVLVFRAMRQELKALMIGSTHKTIYRPTAAEFAIPVPPLDEQRGIVDHIEKETGRIDVLIVKAQQFIDLAKERRSALITAAVSGQIDGRGAV